MAIFLGMKQLVDMLYQFKILDYGMVFMAVLLIGYKFIKEKSYQGMFKRLIVTDYIVMGLALLFGISFLRDTSAFANIAKIESAFIVYMLGRFYGHEVTKHGDILATVGYAVVYSNTFGFFYSLWSLYAFNSDPDFYKTEVTNGGGYFFYKTDLAFGILVACIFIYVFSKHKIAKYLTLLAVVPALMFTMLSRIGQLMLVIFYLMVAVNEIRNALERKAAKNGTLSEKTEEEIEKENAKKKKIAFIIFVVIAVLIIAALIFVSFSAIHNNTFDQLELKKKVKRKLEALFHARHIIWWDTLHYLDNQSLLTRLFGESLTSLHLHNSLGKMAHCMYLSVLYETGWVGIILLLGLIYKMVCTVIDCEDRNNKVLIIFMWMLFLVFGVSVEALESTQMSWFPFIILGAMTSVAVGKKEK